MLFVELPPDMMNKKRENETKKKKIERVKEMEKEGEIED
jgi:hypothetical protein